MVIKKKFVFVIILILLPLFIFPLLCNAADLKYEKGNLRFITTTTKGTSGTKFRTVGFTASFIGSSGNYYETVIKMEQIEELDNLNGTVTTIFEIPFVGSGNTIMQRFNDDYGVQDDFITFFQEDNTLFLDPIITILENGIVQGGVNTDGTLWGEVYTTLPSILGARNWAESTKEDFKDMFGEKVDFQGQDIPEKDLVSPKAVISKDNLEITDNASFMEGENITLSGEKSWFPNYAEKRYFTWRYRQSGSPLWTTLINNGLMSVSPNWPEFLPGIYEVQLEVHYDEYTSLKNTKTITLEITPKPAVEHPIHGVEANPRHVSTGQVYQIIDKSYTLNDERITNWEVEKKRMLKGTTTWVEVMKRQTINNPNLFFGSRSESQEGYYLYTLYKVTDSKGIESEGSPSMIMVTVSNSSTPVPTPIPTPTPFPIPTPRPGQSPTPEPTEPPFVSPMPTPTPTPIVTNMDPVAIILGPDETNAGKSIYISGASSYDPDGTIISYSWLTIGATGTLSGSGGTIKYDSEGVYNIHLTVTDNFGNTNSTVKKINVNPSVPTACIRTGGSLKENRKVILDASDSETPDGTYISSYTWSITPILGGKVSDIKYYGNLTGVTKEILFKSPGNYQVTLTVKNNLGYQDTVSRVITIREDKPPVANFTTIQKILRNPDDSNHATIQLFDQSYSPDGDNICQRIWTYRYDSDNDGSFLDENRIVIDSGNKTSINFKVNEVGKYIVELEVYESFGQDTISGFISKNDYRFDTTADKDQSEKVIEVINVAPVTDFKVTQSKKIDVYVFSCDSTYEASQNLARLNTFKTDLLEQGFDINYTHIGATDYSQVGIYTEKLFGYPIKKKIVAGKDYVVEDNGWSGWVNGDDTCVYYLLQGGKLAVGYYKWDGEPDEGYGYYYDYYGTYLVPIDGVSDVILTQGYSRRAIVKLTNGDYKQIRGYYRSAQDEFEVLVEDISQTSKDNINDAYASGSVLQSISGGILYKKFDGTGYQPWEIYFSGSSIVKKRLASGYVCYGFYTTVWSPYGHAYWELDEPNNPPAFTDVNGFEYWDVEWYSPKPVKGLDYSNLIAGLDLRQGASNYCVFLNSTYSSNSGLVITLNESLIEWLNNNGFKVYIAARENQCTLMTNKSTLDDPIQTLTLNDLANSTNFIEKYDYNGLQDVLDNIKSECQLITGEVISYVIAGDAVEYNYIYSDYENDPVFETKWKYEHDPYYFENSEGLDTDSGLMLSAPKTVLTKPGKYEVVAMTRDNPKNDYLFDSYRKWSDENRCKRIIYVHRRPIADFDCYVFYNGGYIVNVTDNSYDLDHASSPNRGIVESRWQYKTGTTGIWIDGLPATIPGGTYTYIKLEVKDIEGAWSRPKIVQVRGYDYEDMPPSITITPEMRSWGNTNVNVQVSCSGNFDYAEYIWSKSVQQPTDELIRSMSQDFSLSQASEGQWFLHVKGVYRGGVSYKLAGPYCIDKTKPSGTYELSTTDWTNDQVIIHFKGLDTLSGVKRIKLPDGKWVDRSVCVYVAGTNGTYNFTVEDNAGNQSTIPVVIGNIDKVRPSGTFTPDSSNWTKNTINVTFEPSDSGGSRVQKWRYRVSQDNGLSWEEWSSHIIGGVNGTITLNSEGKFIIQAEVVDKAGNIGNVLSGSYKIDKKLPQGIFIPNEHVWTNRNVPVIIGVSDLGGSGVYRWRYRLSPNNGNTYSSWSSYIFDYNPQIVILDKEGIWKIQLEVTDRAGNTSITSSGLYKIDLISPSGTFSPDSSDWTKEDIAVRFSPIDMGGSGVRKWRFRTSYDNGFNWSEWSLYIAESDLGNIILNKTGVWRIQNEVEDYAGNLSTITSNIFLVDKMPPALVQVDITGDRYLAGNNYWIAPGDSINVRLKGYEFHSGMRYSYIRLLKGDNTAVHDWNDSQSHYDEIVKSYFTEIVGASETYENSGEYEVTWIVRALNDVLSPIQYSFTDIAGNNTGYIDTGYSVGIDGTPPGLPGFLPDKHGWTNSNVTIAVSHGADYGSGVQKSQYRYDQGVWQDYDIEFTVSSEGETRVYARTIDNVGNIGESALHIVKIDKTAPGISVNPQKDNTVGFILPVDVNITDAGGSGFKKFRYAWSPGIDKPVSGWSSVYENSCIINLTEHGTSYLHIEAFDNAGNQTYAYYGPYTLLPPEVNIHFGVINKDNPYISTFSAGATYSIVSENDSTIGAIIKSNIEIVKAEVYFNGEKHGNLQFDSTYFDGDTYTYETCVFDHLIPPTQTDGMYEVALIVETSLNTSKQETKNITILTKAELSVEIYNDAERMTYTDATYVNTELGIFNSILSQYSENILIARTSPYVYSVDIELIDEKSKVIAMITLSDDDNDLKWEWKTNITEACFDGVHNGTVVFTATTTNGNVETKKMTYMIRRLKLDNFRISEILDYNWKEYFMKTDNKPTNLALNGIGTEHMPVYRNRQHHGIKLGYMLRFKIDSIGLHKEADYIDINVYYYAVNDSNHLEKADIYVKDKEGAYTLLQNSEYKTICGNIKLDSSNREPHDQEPHKESFNTWYFDFFLPSTAKVVKKGEILDLYQDNTLKHKLLVVFEIVGHSITGSTYDYTLKENLWGTEDGSIYGANKPSQKDLTGKGVNKGEVFLYNLFETTLDDLQFSREW